MLNRTLPLAEELSRAVARHAGSRSTSSGDSDRDLKPIRHPAISRSSSIWGLPAVDQIMIDACKQGLWAMNPPVEAAQPDQSYEVRFRRRDLQLQL